VASGVGRDMNSTFVKRTVSIGDQFVEVAIEDLFWTSLEEIAATQGTTTSSLVAWIDRARKNANLSSAIRVYVVDHFMTKAQDLTEMDDDLDDGVVHMVTCQRPRWLN
jgi:predicted DNA-binding ribbon-helix-helix protein